MSDKVELLAPAGTWDVLERVAQAGADAVYMGGKKYNMRLLKGDYNFSEDEIKAATRLLHEKNKKIYITINNLYWENEIHAIKDYLFFLAEIGVDALIIQDLGIAEICQELNLTIPLHASVQMGIGNSEAVLFLEEHGLTRVILSKNLSLEEIQAISNNTSMGIEIFTHGDLCISHTGQCYMSSFMAGASGNRGRCIKPCRWQYELGSKGEKGYYLAHNDLSLYPFLPELINAGVSSLKIEGRMRRADYLEKIIAIYRQALDDIYLHQGDYQMDPEQLNQLENIKVRNLTAAGIIGSLGADAVDISGALEPAFPTKAFKLKTLPSGKIVELEPRMSTPQTNLAIKVGKVDTILGIKDYCDTIIVGLEEFQAEKCGFSLDAIIELLKNIKSDDPQIWLETPRIVTQKNWAIIRELAEKLANATNLTGFIVNDLGSLNYLSQAGFTVWGGTGLNITNSKAAKFLYSQGVAGLCISPELKLDNLKLMSADLKNWELIIHGDLTSLITDYPLLENHYCGDNSDIYLVDEYKQKYPVRIDAEARTHIFHPYDLSLYDYLPDLLNLNITRMRIEGQFYDSETLAVIVKFYNEKLQALCLGKSINNDLKNLLLGYPSGLTDLSFGKPSN